MSGIYGEKYDRELWCHFKIKSAIVPTRQCSLSLSPPHKHLFSMAPSAIITTRQPSIPSIWNKKLSCLLSSPMEIDLRG